MALVLTSAVPMKTITKIVLLGLFLGLVISKGTADECIPGNVTVEQLSTGRRIRNKAVWKVIVSNKCQCAFENVKLFCPGFQSVKKINSSIISRTDSLCLVNNGFPIYPQSSIKFTYAWSRKITLVPFSHQEYCY